MSEGERRGASFLVRMPRTAAADSVPRTASPTASSAAHLPGVRILVVEDNADARMLVRGILSDAGATVMDVPDVAQALGALSMFRPDVLVSDLGMPDQDGFDLIRQVRALGWSPEILPALALTAFARAEDRRQVLEAGYQSHLSKPLNVDLFIDEIHTLLRRKR